ncbi:hypothetical protein H6Y62_10810 [Staphylococcus lugdunensis]|uniref:DUF1129 family protein n=1 Tax=Staphylococcus lugdunensis TaxID=28035 RepID=A0A292DHR7_STALU|nr:MULTISPECIES: DUF1129 family protein [Staphylococcus]ADC88237.1 hypothetical protein SLGD_02150 [Staphylococcus lugdunensis HKU09-01]AMG61334.1 hypothetical protein AL499_05035 [Staphylococcus lugdunensis]AMG64775.1 hypothetical protein AL501_11155 [Staphylococcus lugdunensis]ARB78435.1 hypothetical protein A6J61_08975 [Staphylococcus lugdunensis]ARJ09966.1 hypothetical protein B7454_11330 [Staphylococcus lugdunensis]
MKSTSQLMRENNVKSLRLNNTDREIFENYMTYVRAELSVNPYDSELMLNRILKQLLKAEDNGTLALEFFNHDPKAHAKQEIRALPNETINNIFNYIYQNFMFLIGIFCFCKGFIGFFIGGNNNRIYLYTFPIIVIIGLFIIFLFIWMIFKTVQLQCFNNKNLVWILTYIVIGLLISALVYVFFIPQSFLAIGPYITISNWHFIIASLIITPIAFYTKHRHTNKNANTRL